MSDGQNVKVLNEEYARVLSNPDNVIVSDDLQELIDLPIQDDESSQPAVDTMVITVLTVEGLPISARGNFVSLSKSSADYSLILSSPRIKKDFLQSLDALTHSIGLLTVQGEYELEITDCEVASWAVTQSTDSDFLFSIQFRSENGIF